MGQGLTLAFGRAAALTQYGLGTYAKNSYTFNSASDLRGYSSHPTSPRPARLPIRVGILHLGSFGTFPRRCIPA